MVLEENPKWELLADVLSEIEEDLLDDVPDAGRHAFPSPSFSPLL